MKHKTMKHHQFTTTLIEWIVTGLIGAVLAVLMIGLIFAASIQHADRLSEMAVMEVSE